MLRVRHSVQDRNDRELSSSLLEQWFKSDTDAERHIENLQMEFAFRGFDGKNGRWWGRNEGSPFQVNYWWIEYTRPD